MSVYCIPEVSPSHPVSHESISEDQSTYLAHPMSDDQHLLKSAQTHPEAFFFISSPLLYNHPERIPCPIKQRQDFFGHYGTDSLPHLTHHRYENSKDPPFPSQSYKLAIQDALPTDAHAIATLGAKTFAL